MKTRLLALLLSLSVLSIGQTQALEGTIIDQNTEEPIGFATVYLNGTTRGTTTDDEGRFRLRNR